MSKYNVIKRDRLWYVVDEDGYDVSGSYDFKYEALEGAKICAADDAEEKKTAERIAAENEGTVRELNDRFRTSWPFTTLGQFIVTVGVSALTREDQQALFRAVKEFSTFNEGNDPHGEHDFGSIDYRGVKYFWKIDYYAKDMEHGSDDPADPAVTTRILTLMEASEY